MAKSASEIFNEKVSLIYEYDKRSPLFVRMANTEIENNNIERAIEILNNGLKIYPQYPVGYFLLAKALTLLGNYSIALKNVKKGSDLIHSKRTYDFYLKEIENIKKQRSLFESSKRTSFLSADAEEEKSEPDLFAEQAEVSEKSKSLDERLEQLAKEISRAKIPEINHLNDMDYSLSGLAESNMIISETLAKIYVAQGEYNEAITVYKKLALKDPKKAEYYSSKIKEIKSDLEN